MNYYSETDSKKNMNKTSSATGMEGCGSSFNQGMDMPNCGCSMMPIYECPQERVCHRYICYDVPHIIPCNTRIINHHIYRHTYCPEYTYCEENVCENTYERGCC